MKNKQFILLLEEDVKERLFQAAREVSVAENKTISVNELIRRMIDDYLKEK